MAKANSDLRDLVVWIENKMHMEWRPKMYNEEQEEHYSKAVVYQSKIAAGYIIIDRIKEMLEC